MLRRNGTLTWGTLWLALFGGCATEAQPTGERRGARPSSEGAAESLVHDVRRRFRLPVVDSATDKLSGWRSALDKGDAAGFDRDGTVWRPRFEPPRANVRSAGAEVSLPSRADDPFALRDERSTVALSVRLLGAVDVDGEPAEGYMVYRNALGASIHVIHRPTVYGTEDFILFEHAPASASLRYEIDLTEVAGLRLVPPVVEAVDAVSYTHLTLPTIYSV